MRQLETPVVLFVFKRVDKTIEVLNRIKEVKPKKLYILSDYGRNEAEVALVEQLRVEIERNVDWECELVKRYAEVNLGVYHNIGLGAKWVLEREQNAIFLEDDNLPELSFFQFCEEMLEYYKDDSRVLWVCGTNYLKKYEPKDGSSYMFTKHMLPCGWASWSHKFCKFYDGNLELFEDSYLKTRVKSEYSSNALLQQDIETWESEKKRLNNGDKPFSWDYQMSFSMKVHGLLAIVPKFNQIKNIGVDLDSIHGGTSFDNEMTRRFCGLDTFEMQFPLKHPKAMLSDLEFESRITKIVLLPWKERIAIKIGRVIKAVFNIPAEVSLKQKFKLGK